MKKKAAGKRHPLARPDVVLKQIPINLGIAAHYRATLRDLLEKMRNDLDRTLKKAYPKAAEVMALDAQARKRALMATDAPDPMVVLQRLLRLWGRRWIGRFDQASGDIAAAFANRSQRNLDTMFRRRLRDVGFTVKFKPTRRMVAAFRAISAENVNLIRSIPRQYSTQVLSIVNQGVMRGGDLHDISKNLRERFHVSHERAALIARDQNAKARAVFEEARRAELGIEEAVWMHSSAGAVPRKTHQAMHGRRYNIRQGMYDPDPRVQSHVWPGSLINCRCTSRSVLPGMDVSAHPAPEHSHAQPGSNAEKVNISRALLKSAIDPNRSRKP